MGPTQNEENGYERKFENWCVCVCVCVCVGGGGLSRVVIWAAHRAIFGNRILRVKLSEDTLLFS